MEEFLLTRTQMRSRVCWWTRKCSAVNKSGATEQTEVVEHTKAAKDVPADFSGSVKDWRTLQTTWPITHLLLWTGTQMCAFSGFSSFIIVYLCSCLCVCFGGVSVSLRVSLISMCVSLRYVPSFVSADYSFPFEVRQLAQRGRSERRLRAGFHTSPAAACHLGGICACRPQRNGEEGKESIGGVEKEEERKKGH